MAKPVSHKCFKGPQNELFGKQNKRPCYVLPQLFDNKVSHSFFPYELLNNF